eukprot:TRINITY_DN32847_c0_g1_i1.p1 TRINITY_DN32847_c0_g1~~TRINITY_DN32847_c0_g1_i1.p1  ORF type:complete len:412 (-),score=53.40 TRINITY_DN32847_c0_g1_i1:407-1642(-)
MAVVKKYKSNVPARTDPPPRRRRFNRLVGCFCCLVQLLVVALVLVGAGLIGAVFFSPRCLLTPEEVDFLQAQVQSLKASLQEKVDALANCEEEAKLSNKEVAGLKTQLTSRSSHGYNCSATAADMHRYLNYKPHELCPDDWWFVQELIYQKQCYALPRRRCRNHSPEKTIQPLPLPEALWNQSAFIDDAVLWDAHQCKSFACLNRRVVGDCRACFNLTLEEHRWKTAYQGSLTIQQVVDRFNGTLRLGLDVGGGTGSFAAHMAKRNVTILTTSYNMETSRNKIKSGLPYMESIALRGLMGLHWPLGARLPLFDNTLDLIHAVSAIKYLPLLEFEEMLYDWNRVLRPGGAIWLEMFYAPEKEMDKYVTCIRALGYHKSQWQLFPKKNNSERKGPHLYLQALLFKPPHAIHFD